MSLFDAKGSSAWYVGTKAGFRLEVVFLRQRQEETFERRGQEIQMPAREVYPGDEDLGTYGFTYRTLGEPEHDGWTATGRFDWLCNGRRARGCRMMGVLTRQKAQ
jgi:hypothetical protein